jgi:aminomuconate-semialdehyde/2-hydroxymuconate-6-semialdehyde dehydrogenase
LCILSSSGSRIFVERSIYDTFLRAFVDHVKTLTVGDPSDESNYMGSLSSEMHRQKVLSMINDAVAAGGKVECGGCPPKLSPPFDTGAFVMPTVISGLSPHSVTATEEIFGPVVTIHAFDTEEEVIGYANCTRYGLAGSIWTTNLTRAHRVAASIKTGMLWINCWLHRDLRVPFGGVKDSGVGTEGGHHSLDFYSEQKNVCIYLGRP